MLILLNIGNTNTQIGYVEELGSIARIETIPTAELSMAAIPAACHVAAATVVPEVKQILTGADIFWIKTAANFNVNFDLVDFTTLGSDRIANAAALAAMGALPGMVIDCGTAVTFEIVDADKKFYGGAIAPGRNLMGHALNDYTAQLPLIEFKNRQNSFGRTTHEAIQLGIDLNFIGGIREFICRIKKQFNGKLSTVAIGGDSQLAVDNIDDIKYGGEDFTLRGIMTLWELNR